MSVHQHFNKDEYHFIDKMIELKTRAIDYYTPQLTHFLNPREQYIVQTLFSKDDSVNFYCYDKSERTRVIIGYDEPCVEDFQVTVLQIDYPIKFETLSHRHILGTLIGVGIKRDMIGDIVTDGTAWQVSVTNQVAVFICQQITKIGGVSVKIKPAKYKLEHSNNSGQLINDIVSSPRVDVIIATFFNVSRQVAKSLIDSHQVSINWKDIIKSDTTVKLFDTISVRRYGRIVIEEFGGETKKGKIKVKAKVFKNKK